MTYNILFKQRLKEKMGDNMYNPGDVLHRELKECIKQKKAVMIIGSGVSIQVSGNKNASWQMFLRQGIERCASVGDPRPRVGWARNMLTLLDLGDMIDWLLIAESVQRRLRDTEMKLWLKSWHSELEIKNTHLVDIIHKLGLPIMTTNYDTLIESVTSRKSISLDEEYQEFLTDAQQHPRFVCYPLAWIS